MQDILTALFDTHHFTIPEMAIRLALACLIGGAIGFDRERQRRAAGLRTHMLVSLAACLFTLLMIEILADPGFDEERIRLDPVRIVEAVTSGVAFLAAGSIIQSRGRIQGLTTGAGLWLAGAVGTAAGLGHGLLVLGAALPALVIVALVRRVEPAIRPPERGDRDE